MIKFLKKTIKKALKYIPSSYIFMFHHVSSAPALKRSGCMLDWEKFGDYMTSIGVIQYRGKLYFAEDYGDAGSWGVNYFCLLKWNVEKKQYDLLAES